MSIDKDHLFEDWNNFSQEDVPEGMDWNENYNSIRHRIQRERKKQQRIRGIVITLVGLILIGSSRAFFLSSHDEPHLASGTVFTLVQNTTDTIARFKLGDSTQVALYPHSMLVYTSSYNQRTRELYLVGAGEFDVHRDHFRPFIVYADNLTIKAIGTKFLVKNGRQDLYESVLLEEGIIQVSDRVVRKAPRILAVNDQFIWNRSSGLVEIVNKSKKVKTTPKKETQQDDKMLVRPTWFSFDNAALPAILDRLSVLYGTPVSYRQNDLAKLHFIGRFDKEDSLEHIIQVITSLNELKYKKEKDGTYIIYK